MTLAPQRQVTLTALLQTQHVLARGHFTAGQGFERMVCLVDVALRSTSLSGLQALQQEAQAWRPSPGVRRSVDAHVDGQTSGSDGALPGRYRGNDPDRFNGGGRSRPAVSGLHMGTMKTMLARILPVRRALYTFQRWG